jgi:penicillin-binding protein 1A
VVDAPPDVGYQAELERVWKPENFGGKYWGETGCSGAAGIAERVSIKLLQRIGVPAAVEHVRRFGIDGVAIPENLSLALGSGGVAPLELAAGYGVRQRRFVEPFHRPCRADGELLYAARPAICPDCNPPRETVLPAEPETPELITDVRELFPPQRAARAISPQNAYLMTDMLKEVVRAGSGARARRELERNDMAGKTGTTNEGRETWFVGFNADVVGAAWVGFDQDRPLGGNEQGGITAIPMWIDYMREALGGLPEHTRPRPPGIVEYRINPLNGLIASDGAANSIFEKFDIDHVPEREPDAAFSSPSDVLAPGTQVRPGEPIF